MGTTEKEMNELKICLIESLPDPGNTMGSTNTVVIHSLFKSMSQTSSYILAFLPPPIRNSKILYNQLETRLCCACFGHSKDFKITSLDKIYSNFAYKWS